MKTATLSIKAGIQSIDFTGFTLLQKVDIATFTESEQVAFTESFQLLRE
jgi:hypothetical protein